MSFNTARESWQRIAPFVSDTPAPAAEIARLARVAKHEAYSGLQWGLKLGLIQETFRAHRNANPHAEPQSLYSKA
jgi:hypothetical protein